MEFRPVFHARNAAEAALVCNWLEDAGIKSNVIGGHQQSGALEVVEADPIVVVASEDLEQAENAIREFRELTSKAPVESVSDAEGQFDWPLCPVCDELRQATCDNCQVTSSEFATERIDDQISTICLACKQQVTITFVDKCRYCQHQFDEDESAPAEGREATNIGRVLLLLGGLAALFLVLIWLFSRFE
jgi:hypothetical protein